MFSSSGLSVAMPLKVDGSESLKNPLPSYQQPGLLIAGEWVWGYRLRPGLIDLTNTAGKQNLVKGLT